jgi:nucleoid DNA-binding protein
LNHTELCYAISQLTGDSPRTVQRIVKGLNRVIFEEVARLGSVPLHGLGRFNGSVQKGWKAPNALKGGAVSYVPERIIFRFSTSETARERLARVPIPKRLPSAPDRV